MGSRTSASSDSRSTAALQANAASNLVVAVASTPPPDAPSSSGVGVGTLVIVAVLVTMAVCCVLGCCMMKQVCGCLFGGVEDAFDGDGHIGETAQAEEAALAGLAGYEMAGKSLF